LLKKFVKIRQVEFRFLLLHPVNRFKNLVKTHGGILVKTEKRKCHKVKY